MKITEQRTLKQSLLLLLAVTVAVLFIPLVATIMTPDFNWGIEDFLFAGLMIFNAGFIYERGIRNITNNIHRAIAAIFLIVFIALIWVEAAVGIFN